MSFKPKLKRSGMNPIPINLSQAGTDVQIRLIWKIIDKTNSPAALANLRVNIIPAIIDGVKKGCDSCRKEEKEPPTIQAMYDEFIEDKHWPKIFKKLDISEQELRKIIEENLR